MTQENKTSRLEESIEYYNDTFCNAKGMNIFCYYWKPRKKSRGLLLISPGYREHCFMYNELAIEMAKRGFFVFAHDYIGHGHSDGCNAFISGLEEVVEDSIAHIKLVRKGYADLPFFICGHSLGGSVAIFISLEEDIQVSGITLIAPALATNPVTASAFKLTIGKLLYKIFPNLPISPVDYNWICRNKQKIEEMYDDPLIYKGYMKMGPCMNIIESITELLLTRLDEVKVPFLLLHGDNDKICHIDGSCLLYEKASSIDKTFKVYEGAYHSLLNEPDEVANDVFDRTVKWIDERV